MIEGIKMSGGEEEGGLQKLEGIRVKEGERGRGGRGTKRNV